ncbi:TetR family transcriptional regulator [Streptomyces luteolus]|uniref:TetR family transcriptional regulator n=1 Tax=Streptomyces luteolus TaxID=3043615 RepID=A0ABT6T760_9ACTN|nr:TetR family transcriptional regulator [Streptomyces sp. B-S-A12]MDI3423205.1 TetR family transcriptional regulator [Streptomyces sp. B-S-A12]
MSHSPDPPGTRQAQKLRTRQALMSASLELLEQQSLSSLGLREVTRAVGISPAGFYRHFCGIPDLGVALVEETLGSLRALTAAILAETGDTERRIARTVELIARHVAEQPAYFRFLVRERTGGVAPVRRAIATQLDLFSEELTEVLAAETELRGWQPEDLRMLAGMYVDQMVMTAAALLEAGPDATEETARITRATRRRLRLINVGSAHWLDEGQPSSA